VAREAHCRWVAGDGAAVPGLEQTGFLHHQNEHIIVNTTVPAPPRIGRRSKLDGETERRRSQATGAGMIESIIEEARVGLSTSDSLW
jgi:hypothetical protein